MGITVKKNFNEKKYIQERLSALEKKMGRVCEEEIGEIVKRTQSGRDVNLQAFAPYSIEYSKAKAKSGRSTNPDLTYSGQLLQAIQSKVKKVGSTIEGLIYILAGRKNRGKGSSTNIDVARGVSEKRKFFGLDRNQKQRIIEKLKNA